MMMDTDIISGEIIRPSSPAIHHLKPFKLCLFDQFTPTINLCSTYPLLFQESPNGPNGQTSSTDYLKNLNHFLPCSPFRKEPNPMEAAQFAVQVNIFDCGGIAIGLCASPKIIDGITLSAFLNTWAATTGGPCKYKTRRFVFDAKEIATLRAKAKSERVENPTRIESLSSFICKHARAASRLTSGSPRPSILAQAVSIRRKTKPRLSDSSMGNIFWWALAACDYNSAESTEIELRGLVATLKGDVAKIDSDVGILQGHEGFTSMIKKVIQKATMELFSKENLEIFAFTNWITFGFNEIDFGWGKPIWVGLMGEAGSGRKLTVLQKTISGNGIEAWVTLEDYVMAILE
ncbi:hypothetical protein ACB092_09G126300 [Castanea dentata]